MNDSAIKTYFTKRMKNDRLYLTLDPDNGKIMLDGLPVEAVDQPSIRRHDISMRDRVAQLAAIPKNADEKIVLAGLSAGQQAEATVAQSPEPNPLAPGQFGPTGPVFVPMQDDRVAGSSLHRPLPTSLMANSQLACGTIPIAVRRRIVALERD